MSRDNARWSESLEEYIHENLVGGDERHGERREYVELGCTRDDIVPRLDCTWAALDPTSLDCFVWIHDDDLADFTDENGDKQPCYRDNFENHEGECYLHDDGSFHFYCNEEDEEDDEEAA